MIPLHEDQINAPAFQKLCTHIWSDDLEWAYTRSVIEQHNPNLKVINGSNMPDNESGILYVGLSHLIERIFSQMKDSGRWIVIHRTNDRSFTKAMYRLKPECVKHIYTVDCAVNESDVTAIPFGLASIGGYDDIIGKIVAEDIPKAATQIFVRYNVNNSGYTEERKASISQLQAKPFAKVITEQIPADEFYREIKAHKFTMSLKGQGMDCARTYSSMILGSIPIVTDCTEMRHFNDMPLVYCPPNINYDITEEWLNSINVSGRTTERIRMSFWENHLNKMKWLLQ